MRIRPDHPPPLPTPCPSRRLQRWARSWWPRSWAGPSSLACSTSSITLSTTCLPARRALLEALAHVLAAALRRAALRGNARPPSRAARALVRAALGLCSLALAPSLMAPPHHFCLQTAHVGALYSAFLAMMLATGGSSLLLAVPLLAVPPPCWLAPGCRPCFLDASPAPPPTAPRQPPTAPPDTRRPDTAPCTPAGVPPVIAALSLGFMSNLFGSITHFGSGQAAVYYGAGAAAVPGCCRCVLACLPGSAARCWVAARQQGREPRLPASSRSLCMAARPPCCAPSNPIRYNRLPHAVRGLPLRRPHERRQPGPLGRRRRRLVEVPGPALERRRRGTQPLPAVCPPRRSLPRRGLPVTPSPSLL